TPRLPAAPPAERWGSSTPLPCLPRGRMASPWGVGLPVAASAASPHLTALDRRTPTRSTQKTPGVWTRLVVHTPGDAVSGAPTASGRNHAAARTSALGAPRCVRN